MSLEYYLTAFSVPLLFRLVCGFAGHGRRRWFIGVLWLITISLLVAGGILFSSTWMLVAFVAGVAVTLEGLMRALRADVGIGTFVPALGLWVLVAPIVVIGIVCTFGAWCF
ncbi:MAG TPA: hypothetical protein VJV22_16475 [Acidobacteriaceae bacterium]|nr:hypothetical protein [Acidobacteriaceae bacterium]